MTTKAKGNSTFGLLKDSLDEAQISVRAYDTKAQIVGVGYIFALNVIGDIGQMVAPPTRADAFTIFIAWFLVVMPIAFFGYVLYPVRKSTQAETSDGRKHIFYLHPERYEGAAHLIRAVEECDPIDEIANELIQVSIVRESKRKRFVTALAMAGFTFSLLFASQVLTSFGVI